MLGAPGTWPSFPEKAAQVHQKYTNHQYQDWQLAGLQQSWDCFIVYIIKQTRIVIMNTVLTIVVVSMILAITILILRIITRMTIIIAAVQ